MAFQRGHQKLGGRSKGSANKLTADVKAMIEAALNEVGGVDYLTRQANEKPVAFLSLLGKLLPRDVNAKVGAEYELKAWLWSLKRND